MLRWRVGAGWWLLVITGLPVLTVGTALLLGDSLKSIDPVWLVISQVGLLAVNENGIAAGLLEGDARALAMPIAVIVLTAVTAIVIRRRLTRAYRAELDARQDPVTQSR
jgi:hypothetical protein